MWKGEYGFGVSNSLEFSILLLVGSRIARSYRIHVYEVDYLCKPSSGTSIFINCP